MTALSGADRLLFGSPETPTQAHIRRGALSLLFLFGAVWWMRFFDFGNASLTTKDWAKESAYLRVLAEALRTLQIPWHSTWRHLQGTRNFLGNPEVVLTPDIVLLRWIDPATFVLCHTVLWYAAGFVGTMRLARRFRVGLVGIVYFFALFNFNGYITAHMTVGHFQWTGYFLLPLYFGVILRLTDSSRPVLTDVLSMAILIGLLFLNGSLHIAIWCLLFFLLVAAFRRDLVAAFFLSTLGAALLAACRWVPGVFSLSDKRPSFLFGYPSLSTLLAALASVPSHYFGEETPITAWPGWWEYDVFVGFVGLAFLLLAAATLIWRRQKPFDQSVIAAAIAMFVLSLGDVWSLVSQLDVPLLGVERVSTRFIAMPLMAWLIVLMAGTHEWATTTGRVAKTALLIGLPFVAWELLSHAEQWRVLVPGPPDLRVARAGLRPGMSPDRAYAAVVYASWSVSVIAWALIGGTLLRRRIVRS
jgi:hypothetical protein